MSGEGEGFTPRFLAVLGAEQRRSVLDTIGGGLARSATLGEIVDAASTLGWGEGIGQLRLIDLADVLLRKPVRTVEAPAADEADEDVDEDEDDVDEGEDDAEDDEVQAAPKSKRAAKPAAKKSTKRAAAKAEAKKPEAKKPEAKKSEAKKPAAKPAKKGKGKKAAVPSRDAFDERMSLDEAVAAFVPLVESLGEATMQDLEEATGLGRRKLRFHVGQLVKHGHLTRHGMGRGTFYTV